MLVQFVLNVLVLSDFCFSVLITLIESYELLCVCVQFRFHSVLFLIVVIMIFQCEHEHSVCSKACNLVTITWAFHLVQYYDSNPYSVLTC